MTAKIVFMGTAAFSVPALRMLAARTDVTVSLVISQPSRAAGRGKQPTPPPVAAAALDCSTADCLLAALLQVCTYTCDSHSGLAAAQRSAAH